jgi:U3 small nucleolar RNA-associated protein 14
VELTEIEQARIESDIEDSDSDSDISEIDLDQFDDEPDFELNFPKNSVCAAHTLQLVLKDVFENCAELKALNQVNF